MNKKPALIKDDILLKLICTFAEELSFPLAHIITATLKGTYPNIWKQEINKPSSESLSP